MTALHIAGLILISLAAILFGLFKLSSHFRDVIGIRKDLLDIEKSKADIARFNSLIISATDEDIKKFDPKRAELEENLKRRHTYDHAYVKARPRRWLVFLQAFALLILLIGACYGVFYWFVK